MLAVQKWAQGRPFLIALFAPQIAAFAREIPDILKYQKKHRLQSNIFAIPDLDNWYCMYLSPQKFIVPFLEMLCQASPYCKQLVELAFYFISISQNPESVENNTNTPEQNENAQIYLAELLNLSFAEIESDFDDSPISEKAKSAVHHYKDTNETALAFLYLVAFPCWLVYKEFPSNLYHKAVNGDTKSIHKLLRLDPFTLHDQAIGKQIQFVRIHGKRSEYEELLNAPLKPLKSRLNSRTIKDMLASMISFLADSLNSPLTSTEIRDLFDAVAQDADKLDIDSSLPESQEAFSKAIQRNRSGLKDLFATGQINLK